MYYRPRSTLITGVAGFIPSNVAVYLVTKYPQVSFVGLDKMSYCSDKRNIAEILDKPNFTLVEGDICDSDLLNKLWEQHRFDTVLHFAAYTHVDLSFISPILYTRNNVVGTHVLLEAARAHQVLRFIHVSTDEVYGSSLQSHTEESKLAPTNPYSASKAAAEMIVQSYITSFGLPAIITRGNNVYGPKQYPEKVIPKFILRLLNGDKCEIQGSGLQSRSFLYTEDVCEAFDTILHRGDNGAIYNIGSDDECTIRDLATILSRKIVGRDIDCLYVADRSFNDVKYNIDCSKLAKLGWKQKVTLDQGLDKTIQWYRDNHERYA
jgi:dTDP-glucose 4,6-dehydratase